MEWWVEGKKLPENPDKAIKIIMNFFKTHGWVAIDIVVDKSFNPHPYLTTVAHILRREGALWVRRGDEIIEMYNDPSENKIFISAYKFSPDLLERVIRAYIYTDIRLK
jgi:hypothetical protein